MIWSPEDIFFSNICTAEAVYHTEARNFSTGVDTFDVFCDCRRNIQPHILSLLVRRTFLRLTLKSDKEQVPSMLDVYCSFSNKQRANQCSPTDIHHVRQEMRTDDRQSVGAGWEVWLQMIHRRILLWQCRQDKCHQQKLTSLGNDFTPTT